MKYHFKMEKTNFALISALYSSVNHGLYSDIYFPIIKYALASFFSQHGGSHPYCSADEIHGFILDKFGISIPHIVISKSILKIDTQRCGNVKLNVYENGDTFQIQSASFDCDDVDLNDRERAFSDSIIIIEAKYKEFLEREGSIDDGISFIQFISDNTEDILGYFENQDTSKVDEKYATMVFFLQYLSDHEKKLYQVANQLFWGSVIAGFLKSDKPQVEEGEDGIKSEYFLDTSIVMGVLELSTPQRETYSQEVCDIIKAAGGILRANPMTIDEISCILQSVEQNGPNPLTDIASACERRNLEANELAQIRLSLSTEIEKKGISVFPPMNQSEKQKIIQSYQGKKITRLLGESRTKRPASYSSDNYREIHDVFMDDFIKERRMRKGNDNHVFFLTSNRDLIAFCKTMHPTVDYMKSTGKVILELWMHNTKPVDISGCILTETMARCLDLHSTRVRNKIAEVSRLYNKTKSDFNADVYKDFIKKLYSRAKHVIQAVEDPDKLVEGEFGKLIKDAVAADNLAYNKEAAKVRNENMLLTENIALKEEEIKSKIEEVELLTSENQKKQKEIVNITEDRNRLLSELENKEKERKQVEDEKQKEFIAKQKAEKINSLYRKRDELKKSIEHVKADIISYEKSLEKSFCNWQPKFFYILGGICIFCVVALWILSFVNKNLLSVSLNEDKYSLSLILVPIGALFIGIGHHFDSIDSVSRRKEKAKMKWLEKKENTKYAMLKDDLSRYNEELWSIEDELKTDNI
ncbi:MAG: hypothetical protein E7100_08460 [Bacteroidaceae bacterium]|nr:hypothetical protein [Bacteroidaceae bacterium]